MPDDAAIRDGNERHGQSATLAERINQICLLRPAERLLVDMPDGSFVPRFLPTYCYRITLLVNKPAKIPRQKSAAPICPDTVPL